MAQNERLEEIPTSLLPMCDVRGMSEGFMMGSKVELSQLLEHVEKAKAKSVDDVKTIVDKYFSEIEFSSLKYEWDMLSIEMREQIYNKIFVEVSRSLVLKQKTSKKKTTKV